jgi:hypothetical protein
MGSAYGSVSVRNTATTACLLAGSPKLALLDQDGVTWHSSSTVDRDSAQPTGPMVLVPGSWAVDAPFRLGNSCGGYGRTVTLRLTLPRGGGTASVPWVVGTDGPDRCTDDGPQPSPAPHPGDLDLMHFRPTAPNSLGEKLNEQGRRLQLIAPASARRGSLLKYSVRISARPVAGAGLWERPDCPLFRQTLVRTGPTYEFNCPEAPFLEEGQALDFAMQVSVPKDAPLGPATLSWQLVEPEQAPLTTTVAITP